jgi:hypothetical protein
LRPNRYHNNVPNTAKKASPATMNHTRLLPLPLLSEATVVVVVAMVDVVVVGAVPEVVVVAWVVVVVELDVVDEVVVATGKSAAMVKVATPAAVPLRSQDAELSPLQVTVGAEAAHRTPMLVLCPEVSVTLSPQLPDPVTSMVLVAAPLNT